jgi:hypothetical protein
MNAAMVSAMDVEDGLAALVDSVRAERERRCEVVVAQWEQCTQHE